MKLTDDQQRAHDMIVSTQFGSQSLLTGFAGTGKTHTIGQAVKTLLARGKRVTVACPTHKAAAVASVKIGKIDQSIIVGTLHSVLGMRAGESETGQVEFGRAEKTIGGYLIVDEASMIGDQMHHEILRAAERAAIIWVGDDAQLPPVQDGDVSPVFRSVSRRAHLSQVVRQETGNPIIGLSAVVRSYLEVADTISANRLSDAVNDLDPTGTRVIVAPRNELADYTAQAIQSGLEARYIGYTNADCIASARYIRERIHGQENPPPYVIGEPVTAYNSVGSGFEPILRNNEDAVVSTYATGGNIVAGVDCYLLDVTKSNGKTATIYSPVNPSEYQKALKQLYIKIGRLSKDIKLADAARQRDKSEFLSVERDKLRENMRLLRDGVCDLHHACAITAHKSQGSTYDVACVDFVSLSKIKDERERMRALYVAVTRPSKFLVLGV